MQNNQPQTKTSDLQEINIELHQASLLENNSHLHKVKPIFNSHATWRCMTSSDPSYISKYQPKSLFHISISHLDSQEIGMSGLRKLHKVLVSCKRVISLTPFDAKLNSKQMTYLFYSTNHWRRFPCKFASFAETISRFSRCKHLEFFPLAKLAQSPGMQQIIQPVNQKLLNRIQRQLKELPKVKGLALSSPFYPTFNFKSQRSLKNLHLFFQNNDTFVRQELSELLSNLQECNQLELNFFGDYRIEVSDVKIWSSFFQNTSISFKKLSLSLALQRPQQLEELPSFIASFAHLKNTTSLDLSFMKFLSLKFETQDFFYSLSTSLQSLTQLEELRLIFLWFPILKNESLMQLTLMLRCLKNLKKLQINLPPLQSPDQGLVSISESLKDLRDLQILEIETPKSDFTQKSLEIFSNNIANHKLTSFSLTPPLYDHIDDSTQTLFPSIIRPGIWKFMSICKRRKEKPTLLPFFSSLGRFAQLSTLKLPLSTFNISNEEWNSLSVVLRFKEISSFVLALPKLDSENNFEGFQSVLASLQNLPKLTSLILYFKKEISDQEVDILASYLAGCPKLKTLTLQFNKSSQIGDQSLYSLLSGIRVLLGLEHLYIDFWEKEPFGEKVVTEFFKGLVVLKGLSSFAFQCRTPLFKHISLPVDVNDFYNMRRLTACYVNSTQLI